MTEEEIKQKWKKLLNPIRFRDTKGTKQVNYKDKKYDRNPYDSDYSRISLSAPFRRLQDKAQVFPLEKNDFVRTRLTHSLEVSGLARSIGTSVENFLFDKNYLEQRYLGYIPSLLSVAGLIHDIGNPPFGHFGEKTIQLFFEKYFKKNSFNITDITNGQQRLTESEKADFLNFDGNVQGLRLLLRLAMSDDNLSYNLTFPTLASMIKYPKSSTEGNIKDYRTKGGIEFKKFGFFESDKNKFEEIDQTLGLNGHRHPLVHLLEAADDIAYSVSDIEDGCKKGCINWEILIDTLDSDEFKEDIKCIILSENLKKKYEKLGVMGFPEKLLLIAQDCRIQIQGQMISDVIAVFLDNHEKILNGELDKELIEISNSKKLREFTKRLAMYNLESKYVLKNELVGENVITFLMENFIQAVTSKNKNNTSTKEGKLYNIISNHYKYIQTKSEYKNNEYNQLMLVTDYICGMTDTYALALYKELKGINEL